MDTVYRGPLVLQKFSAQIDLSQTSATINANYLVRNPTAQAIQAKAGILRKGVGKLVPGGMAGPSGRVPKPQSPTLGKFKKILAACQIEPSSEITLTETSTEALKSGAARTFSYIPSFNLDGASLEKRVPIIQLAVDMPPTAKNILSASIPPTKIETVNGRLRCVFERTNAFITPLIIKWTESDIKLTLSKSAKLIAATTLEVAITVKNDGGTDAKDVRILDDYSSGGAVALPGQSAVKSVAQPGKSARVRYEATFDLGIGASQTFTYRIGVTGIGTTVPPTVAHVGTEIVGISLRGGFIKIPPLFRAPRAAFALPSGWSFDYLHDGDHHLNEHGIWCAGQVYDALRQKLAWSTSCIFADKNFDDDYRWSVSHQILRFNPGFAHHVDSPWLAKAGNTTEIDGEFRHEDLKQFENAIVLLRGWRFDFTDDDHHINVVKLMIGEITFNRAQGLLNWKVKASYADQNFDDNYRFQYSCTILGFNGKLVYCDYNGSSGGGTAAKPGAVTDAQLKGFTNAIVVPLGWSFDYSDSDHHINENSFKIQNVTYNSATGNVKWTAHLSFFDQNGDDDYTWAYRVAVIATSSGESRDYPTGPFSDDGGLDSRNCNVDLNALFVPITWTNGIRDGSETGVDCGGDSPARDMTPIRDGIYPGTASSSSLFSLRDSDERTVVRLFALQALYEYADKLNQDFDAFYAETAPERADRYVEAVASYVDSHMVYAYDGFFGGTASAYETLTDSAHKGAGDFNGDCEDFAILRAALLRALGFGKDCIFCADHHNGHYQKLEDECYGDDSGGGGHTFNIVVYKGKYRILDYGPMRDRYWANKQSWTQNAVDNIWNDHTGEHWSRNEVAPFGSGKPMVNYPGNPCSPSANWDWRTYYCDVTQ